MEMAIQMDQMVGDIVNTVRFAWWGAEEEGLLGSRYYVASLSSDEKDRIAVYINHDMLASPNYILFIKNASDAPNVLPGGVTVQNMYESYYSSRALPYGLDQMRSGSDFQPFVEHNITSAAVAAGAGNIKTAKERSLYSGLANGHRISSLPLSLFFFSLSLSLSLSLSFIVQFITCFLSRT